MDEPGSPVDVYLEQARAALDRGEPQDAADILADAMAGNPELGRHVDPGRLARLVMRLCTTIGDAPSDGRGAGLVPFLTMIRHAVTAHPDHSLLLGAGSALARRMGESALAVEWALHGARARPSKLGEIWLGYAYRGAGRIPEALAALRRAVAYDPDDLSVYADIATTLAHEDRLDDALAWVDRALARDPEFGCAVHTGHRLRHRADGDLAHLVRLADFQRDHPDDGHQHSDLATCCADVPWLSRVPAAPRRPVDPRRYRPPTPHPSTAAAERLRRIAHPLWPHPPAAYDAALGLVLVAPDELLALLARPPAAPDTEAGRALAEHDPALWERSARVFACLGLLHHDADEPWLESSRRRRLVGLAFGGIDVITEAAVFALVTYAWIDPGARPDVAALIARRLADVTGGRRRTPHDIAWSLAHLALATPDLGPDARQLAAEVVRADEEAPSAPRGRLLRWLTSALSR